MKKKLLSRIFGLVVLYAAVFCVLVIIQFTNQGDFTLLIGGMSIRGRFLETEEIFVAAEAAAEDDDENDAEIKVQAITGGIRIYYGGIEFNLKEERGRGMSLTSTDGIVTAVNPSFMIENENSVQFGLPDGSVITFSSFDSARGPELQIAVVFADDTGGINIPITARRSLVRDNDQLGILYNGVRYMFANGLGQELENNRINLTRESSIISYRARPTQRVFDPADYIIPEWQNYEREIANWHNSIYTYWRQNASSLQLEEDIVAFCAEGIRNRNLSQAVSLIPSDFINSGRRTHRSSLFIGGMTAAHRSFVNTETENTNRITRLIREGSLDVLKEENVIEFLFTRSSTALAGDFINFLQNIDEHRLIVDHCPGLLEAYQDIKRWRPGINNPVEPLMERILLLISENISKDSERNMIYVSSNESGSLEFSLRLGDALSKWAADVNNEEWLAIGRSMILSIISAERIGNGRIYSILQPSENHPQSSFLMDNGMWAWTVSPNVRATYVNSNINLTVNFPANMSHYIIIRGVRPFLRLQIHGQDWRTDSQFERYDSSGWVYHAQDQILILKLRHRTVTENVRIIYRADPPPPPAPAASETPAAETADNTE